MYVKLFSEILDSSLWSEPAHTRLVWITLLAKADENGFAHVSLPGLAAAARVTLDETLEAVECFCAPDPFSKNPAHDGRRLEKQVGGYQLLNYEAYRDIASKADRRDSNRIAQSKFRLAVSTNKHPSASVSTRQHPSASVIKSKPSEAEAVSDPEAIKICEGAPAAPKAKGVRWKGATRVPPSDAPPEAVKDWLAYWKIPEGHPEAVRFLDHWRGNGATKIDWGATWRNWARRAPEFSRIPTQAAPDPNYRYRTMSEAKPVPREPETSSEQHQAFAAELLRRVGGQ